MRRCLINQQIVLISGRQGSGKTTLQRSLAFHGSDHFDDIFNINFADALYEMHDSVLNVLKSKGITPPHKKDGVLLQLLGTNWGRTVLGENVWVDLLRSKITGLKEFYEPGVADFRDQLIIIADARFRNEFDGFPDALRVRLIADEETRKARTDSWRENTKHPSEIDLDSYQLHGKFDMYFDTTEGQDSPDHCAQLIMAQLKKGNWKEKRK